MNTEGSKEWNKIQDELLEDAKKGVTIRNEAISFIGNCVSMKEQLKREPDFAIIVKVNSLEFGVCDNEKFIEFIDNEIYQAELCINGKPNKYE